MRLPITKRRDSETKLFSPFEQTMSSLREAMNRLFEDAWFRFPIGSEQPLADGSQVSAWWPRTDIAETDKSIRIKMDLPNVDPKDVNIEVDQDSLSVSGTTVKEEEEKDENYIRLERQSGSFHRVFSLPQGLDIDNIEATNKHGALTITIPKKPEKQRKKVTVNVES